VGGGVNGLADTSKNAALYGTDMAAFTMTPVTHCLAQVTCPPPHPHCAPPPTTLLHPPLPPLQVELAQTEYQLPRLTRMWTHLDRVAGGGQVKGVGEKQIEIDKRLLRDKAAALRR